MPGGTQWSPTPAKAQASSPPVSALEHAAMEAIRNGGRVRTWGQLVGALTVLGGVIITLFGFGNGVVPALIAIGITNVLIGMLVTTTTLAFGWHVELAGHTAILLSEQDRESLDD